MIGVQAAPWKLDLLGGISAPTPGVATLTQACTKIYPEGCLGVSYFASRNELVSQHVIQVGHHLTGTMEHAFRIGDEYHLFYVQISSGLGYISKDITNLDNPLPTDRFHKWSVSYGGGLGFEFPIADLIGIRCAVVGRAVAEKGVFAQVGTLVGMRIGAEWFGFGND
ncbi:MAG: hypothetical protein NTV34_09695 [Proteobacteria bacterium]|nr:hypothetical protein [Pseudomonadota bacterium]